MASPLLKTILSNGIFRNVRPTMTSARQIISNENALPEKPKRPANSWALFVRERKDQIMRQNEGIPANKISQILAREWKSMDKTRYTQEYQDSLEIYRKLAKDYESSLTDNQRQLLEQEKNKILDKETIRQVKKLKPPKKPRNIANLYCYERCQEPHIRAQLKTRKPSEVFADVFKDYQNISEEERERYREMYLRDIRRFKDEFLSWYNAVQSDTTLSSHTKHHVQNMKAKYQALKYLD